MWPSQLARDTEAERLNKSIARAVETLQFLGQDTSDIEFLEVEHPDGEAANKGVRPEARSFLDIAASWADVFRRRNIPPDTSEEEAGEPSADQEVPSSAPVQTGQAQAAVQTEEAAAAAMATAEQQGTAAAAAQTPLPAAGQQLLVDVPTKTPMSILSLARGIVSVATSHVDRGVSNTLPRAEPAAAAASETPTQFFVVELPTTEEAAESATWGVEPPPLMSSNGAAAPREETVVTQTVTTTRTSLPILAFQQLRRALSAAGSGSRGSGSNGSNGATPQPVEGKANLGAIAPIAEVPGESSETPGESATAQPTTNADGAAGPVADDMGAPGQPPRPDPTMTTRSVFGLFSKASKTPSSPKVDTHPSPPVTAAQPAQQQALRRAENSAVSMAETAFESTSGDERVSGPTTAVLQQRAEAAERTASAQNQKIMMQEAEIERLRSLLGKFAPQEEDGSPSVSGNASTSKSQPMTAKDEEVVPLAEPGQTS